MLSTYARRRLVAGTVVIVATAIIANAIAAPGPSPEPARATAAAVASTAPAGAPVVTTTAAGPATSAPEPAPTTTPGAGPDPAALTTPDALPKATAGDLIISGVRGTKASQALRHRAAAGQIAGVILMGTNIQSLGQVRALAKSLQSAARHGHRLPLLIMVDQEGGTVKRFRSAAPDGSARDLARLPLDDVHRAGAQTAADLVDRGVNVDLAPVVDVPRSAANFLGTRTFGTTPAAVARNACQFAAGLASGGVMPTFKHFPGLGGAGSTNTDFAPVSIGLDLKQLRAGWKPYRDCATDPGSFVMMSNAVYPALTGSTPAVLSSAATKAARDLGATGPLISDALGAGALAGQPHVASRAITAGVNLALYTDESSARSAYSEIRARVPQRVIAARAAQVQALRAALAG